LIFNCNKPSNLLDLDNLYILFLKFLLKNLIFDDWFNNEIATRLDNLAKVVSLSTKAGIPVPCLSSTLDYLNSYRTNRLPQNLVQAMRDCFGSHTYEIIDREGSFHTEWMK